MRTEVYRRLILGSLTVFIIAIALLAIPRAQAFGVPSLPSDNLVTNPWFRSGANPSKPGLDGWVDAAGVNALWSVSQKDSNPSPDSVTGTSARFAMGSGQGGGTGQGGVDARLVQVVAANSAHRTLRFKTHWVTGYIELATVTIYGGNSSSGPWTQVWVPLTVTQATTSNHAWTQTNLLETTAASGYSYYKIELFGRYPADRNQGVKYTGVYFSTASSAGGPTPTVTPGASPTPEPSPTIPPSGQTFSDVPPSHPYFNEIEALYAAGYTEGCQTDPLMYCPEKGLNRAEMAVYVERGANGAGIEPPDNGEARFADLDSASWANKWAVALFDDGFTSGCGIDPLLFCPWQGHSRGEAAVFFLRVLNGVDYEPPAAQGLFGDTPVTRWEARWVEAAWAAGLIPECDTRPLTFCPDEPMTRGLAAFTMVQAKGLAP